MFTFGLFYGFISTPRVYFLFISCSCLFRVYGFWFILFYFVASCSFSGTGEHLLGVHRPEVDDLVELVKRPGRDHIPVPRLRMRLKSAESFYYMYRETASFYYVYRESETVARCATLGRSQDVCKGSRSTVEGERCVVSS